MVTFLANPNSVHVRRWLDLLEHARVPVTGFTVHGGGRGAYGSWRTIWASGGALRYLVSGVSLRGKLQGRLVHAHNASGYGSMALLAGQPYVLTAYGSEIYRAAERGPLYERVLGRVLRRAAIVTCTSPAMRDHLLDRYGLDPARVWMFSLGCSTRDYYFSAEERRAARAELGLESALTVASTRRMRPMYRIDLIVRAFARLCAAEDGIAELVAQEGITEHVHIVRGMRSAPEVRKYLLASDVVISIPTSDQLSASILEALACGAMVGLSDLPVYRELFQRGLAARISTEGVGEFARGLRELCRLSRTYDRGPAQRWIAEGESDPVVVQEIQRLYDAAIALTGAGEWPGRRE
jgi:glycosyltransferase involved in cell wall biosynthesis